MPACTARWILFCAALATLLLASALGSVIPSQWGCEPGLPPGAVHLVVSTERMELRRLNQWLPHVGLTNAHVYVYYRAKLDIEPVFNLPCNMTVFTRLLEPNKGRESTVFLKHVADFYDADMPQVFAFAHSHGALSWHSQCGPFFRRLRRVQRDMATTHLVPASAAVPDIASLNSGCKPGQGEPTACCVTIFCGRTDNCKMATPMCEEHIARFYNTRQNLPLDILDGLALEQDIPHDLYHDKLEEIPAELKAATLNEDKETVERDGLASFNELLSQDNGTKVDSVESSYVPTWGCCAQYVVRREALLRHNKSFYTQALDLHLATGVYQGRGLESALFHLFDGSLPTAMYDWYTSTDVMLSQIRGCPVHRPAMWHVPAHHTHA